MSRQLLLFSLLFAAALCGIRKNVQFGPLDPDVTDPSTLFMATENPVPQDYCSNPRYPIVPPIGPIVMDILEEVYPNGTARPTNTWLKDLWGFEWDNLNSWAGLYAYPYMLAPKANNINIMYMGRPIWKDEVNYNSRIELLISTPGIKPNVTDAFYPSLVTSAAYDIGLIIKNGNPKIRELGPAHATIDYSDGNTVVATLYMVKGSPFVNVVCTGANLAIGSMLAVPPIIGLNNQPPGSTVTSDAFHVISAQGPDHAAGQDWHFFFDSDVTINFPTNPTTPLSLNGPYTGLVQIGAGETNDDMGDFLNTYRGTYSQGMDVTYDVDDDNNKATVMFNFRPASSPKAAAGGQLAMLALPHHTRVYKGATAPVNTTYWCVKGPMSAIIGNSWNLIYPLTTKGFGDQLPVPASMKDAIKEQLVFDYKLYITLCPGDNLTGDGTPGKDILELYAYVRDLAKYTDIAIAAQNLGLTEMAANMTAHTYQCMQPIFKKQTTPPLPCEPPINGTQNCVRSQLPVYYDTTWGGIITGWFSGYAVDYCEGCDNPEGYYPFANYGNAFYNDHHFQYGYLVKSIAWVLYMSSKGVNINATQSEISRLKKLGLAFARDYGNPTPTDKYFFPIRHKDMFDGHSWAEGYDYSGRILTWVNQQSGGEALNSYYALYLLGLALNDTNIRDWGRIHTATEIVSLRAYQMISNQTADEPCPEINKMLKCMPMIIGNGLTGATYFGPDSLFECGIIILPVTPITLDYIEPTWAGEAFDYLQHHIKVGGICEYPDPVNDTSNPCSGQFDPKTWWDNEWECCPWNDVYPNQQWLAYPDWFPYMYIIQALNNTQQAWKNLTPPSAINKPSKTLPFPYINKWNDVVGYPPGFSRTQALFVVAAQSGLKEHEDCNKDQSKVKVHIM